MAEPCIQSEKVTRLEANYDHLMKDVAEIKSDVKEMKSFLLAMDSKYVRKEEFNELKRDSQEINQEFQTTKGFIFGVKAALGFLGLTSIAGLVAFAKVILKLF